MSLSKKPIKRAKSIANIRAARLKYINEHPNASKEWANTPKAKANSTAAMKKYYEDPEARAKQSVAMKKSFKNPVHRANHSASLKKFHRENLGYHEGRNAPGFKGVNHPRDYHWTCNSKLREEVRERDNHTCQLCGRTREESLRKYGKQLSTHHIYGVEDNNQPCSLSRLITLCRGCHMRIEKKGFEQYITQFEEIVRRNL